MGFFLWLCGIVRGLMRRLCVVQSCACFGWCKPHKGPAACDRTPPNPKTPHKTTITQRQVHRNTPIYSFDVPAACCCSRVPGWKSTAAPDMAVAPGRSLTLVWNTTVVGLVTHMDTTSVSPARVQRHTQHQKNTWLVCPPSLAAMPHPSLLHRPPAWLSTHTHLERRAWQTGTAGRITKKQHTTVRAACHAVGSQPATPAACC